MVRPLFIISFLLSNLIVSGQSINQSQLEFNREFNNSLYLIRQSHYYCANHIVSKIRLYSDKNLIKTLNGTGTTNQNVNTGKIVFGLMKLDTAITRVQIDNHIIDIASNNLKSDLNSKIMTFNAEHIEFCVGIEDVRHDHSSSYTFSDRLRNHGINISVFENCSKVYMTQDQPSIRKMVTRTIYRYWTNRNKTLHYSNLIKSYNKIFSSYFYFDQNAVFCYSTVLMSSKQMRIL